MKDLVGNDLSLGDTIWVDCYKAKVIKITGDGVVGLVLDEGLWLEFYYECRLHDISLDDNGDFVLDTEFFPAVGDCRVRCRWHRRL